MFAITRATCTMGKISNNLEKHGEEDVPAWTIPIVGILVDLAAIEVLLHDAHASEAFFMRNPDTGILEPRPWVASAQPIKLTEMYDGMATTIKLGEEELEFDRCRLKDLVLGRFYPGMAQIDCNLQLYPGLDHANLVLQEFQNEQITLTVLDAKVAAKKKSKQRELPLGNASEEEPKPEAVASGSGGSNVGADDPLYTQVVDWVLESRITSVDAVQVQFKIDRSRALLIMGAMEIGGLVGPVRDDNSRAILVESFEQPPDVAHHEPEDDDGVVGDSPDIAPDPAPSLWPMGPPGSNGDGMSRTGRTITAHAKRTARKKARDARAH